MDRRMFRFMLWSFGFILAVAGTAVTVAELL
jgi:hypothetical protein